MCDECLVQRVIFRAFKPLTTVDVKTRTIFYSKKLKNNCPKLSVTGRAGSTKPQLDIEKYPIGRNNLYAFPSLRQKQNRKHTQIAGLTRSHSSFHGVKNGALPGIRQPSRMARKLMDRGFQDKDQSQM